MSDNHEPKAATDRNVEIGELIRTQDNRITAHPQFIVQQRRRIYGVNHDFTDEYEWRDNEDSERVATEDEVGQLEHPFEDHNLGGDWEKVGYVDIWEFVTACFTEKGCEDYIAANGHLNSPRIYAASAYRNREFIDVREFLIKQSEAGE